MAWKHLMAAQLIPMWRRHFRWRYTVLLGSNFSVLVYSFAQAAECSQSLSRNSTFIELNCDGKFPCNTGTRLCSLNDNTDIATLFLASARVLPVCCAPTSSLKFSLCLAQATNDCQSHTFFIWNKLVFPRDYIPRNKVQLCVIAKVTSDVFSSNVSQSGRKSLNKT